MKQQLLMIQATAMEWDDKPMDADKIEGLRNQLPSESEIADQSAAKANENSRKSTP